MELKLVVLLVVALCLLIDNADAENECTGCTKCSCSAKGMWECKPYHRCEAFETDQIDEELLDAAIEKLDYEKKSLRDKVYQFYNRFHPKGKKYILNINKPLRIVKKKHNLKPLMIAVEKENKSKPFIGSYKKKHIKTASIDTNVKKYNMSSSSAKKDVSNESTGTTEKEINNSPVTSVENKESSNETTSTTENKVNPSESSSVEETDKSNKSISTAKTNETSNESTSSDENKNVVKKAISSIDLTSKHNKEIDTKGEKNITKPLRELKSQKLRQRVAANQYVPVPPKKDASDELLEIVESYKPDHQLKEILRSKRSPAAVKNTENKHAKRSAEKTVKNRHARNSNNSTVKFYSTVDELNEDTLKHSNISGTLHAKKVELNVLPDNSRRSNAIETSNKSLHIDFNQPKELNHITDNKIDITDHDSKFDISHEKLNVLLGNHTQKTKDKNLSKLVVNELHAGTEIIGDSHAPVTSNITFTSENDTLTAMAFIAGNLLNKLWNMEKDASGLSLETEDMKYEKISDLLDLFKEPLNLRQESFLKNALEQLSNAIDKDKDVKNVTICQTIEDATKLIDSYNSTEEEENANEHVTDQVPCEKNNSSKKEKNNNLAAMKAISKINNVLNLMRKFENIQKNISLLKNETPFSFSDDHNFTKYQNRKVISDPLLTKDEASSLNTFGNILDKITNMLLPKNSDKRLANTIKNKNSLSSHQDIKNNFIKMHKIDLNNMTMSAKDKLILDYIEHINSNPDCILNKKPQKIAPTSLPSIEGNILLNLSEFFKMKSFADLINLLQPVKDTDKKEKPTLSPTPKQTTKSTLPTTTLKPTTNSLVDEKENKFASTKDKLKAHLKSIIEDLIELQNSKGIVTRSNIRIADALPCIYKIMNAGKDVPYKNYDENSIPDRIVDIFNTLKKDMKVAQTRRSDSVMPVRPKSAVVLERVIKNFVEKSKVQTRRFARIKVAKPYDELKKIMNKLRNVSSIYKNQALYNEVPAAEKLVLLKTLEEDVRNHIVALEGIKRNYQNLNQLPPRQYDEIATFINNAATNISLDAKIIKKAEKNNIKNRVNEEIDNSNHIYKETLPRKAFGAVDHSQAEDDNMKISRNQIINHLIANRMKIYIKLKEAKEFDLTNDMNYNIAKRVLFYLDSGNFNLAHELFKMLVMQKHDKLGTTNNDHSTDFAEPPSKTRDVPASSDVISQILPMIPLEQPTTPNNQMKWMSQDHLIKQLLNIKNMGL